MLAAALCVVFGIATSQAAAAPRPSVGSSPLDQLTFTGVGNGHNLDVQNGTPGGGSIIVTNSTPGYDESWHIEAGAGDASFAITNNTTGDCIDAGFPARQQPCDGRASEQWYFEPVANSSQNAVMIRQESNGSCLDVVLNAQYNDAWTDSAGCNATGAQQWVLPTGAYSAALAMAVTHAAAVCTKDTSTCTWTTGTQAPAAPLPVICVSPVWYNGTGSSVPWTFSLSTTTGWSSTLSATLTGSLSGGTAPALQGTVSASVTGSVTLSLSTTLGNSLTITVPPAQYGWVGLSELATKVTGNWTFDAQGFAWTANDTVTVPLTSDASGGASIYLAQTSPTFNSCNA